MPRPTYGAASQHRAALLLALLLDYANDELELDPGIPEKNLELLRPQIQTHWQTDQQLVVRTKVRSLQALSQLIHPTPLTGDQIKEALRRLQDFLAILEDNRPNLSGSETWHFTLKLWHHRRDRAAIVQRFDIEWSQRRPGRSLSADPVVRDPSPVPAPIAPAPSIPWLQLCQALLETESRLTTNPLTLRDGITFQWRSLYIPLGVMPIGVRSESDEEDAAILSPTELLTHLQTAPPCRAAIIGEPGAGKTTLLQKLAWDLLAQEQLSVWVGLADLQGVSLEQFLLNDWLKTATQQISVAPELQQALAEQVQQGRVWLLLDGVDEMALEASAALSAIARQLKGWLSQAHVILTCRHQVWASSKNNLDMFETYHNLSFSSPEATQSFIQKWFTENPSLGHSLIQELFQPSRNQIRNTVQNPLRLALLCQSWSRHQGFPATRSMLYQQFVEALYDWKQDILPTSLSQRQQLNQALGQLAIAALRQGQKFRLSHSFILKTWEQAELLELALQLGWLTPVGAGAIPVPGGVANAGEKSYAFYHPTFQEYFAAQAVDWCSFGADWLTQMIEPQWHEVVLFWLGRSDLEVDQKEHVIQSLQQFEDGTGGFYRYRAYFLAAEGLAEFPESQFAAEMVAQLVRWRFGHAEDNSENRSHTNWQWYPQPIQTGSQTALMRTDRSIAITAYENYLYSKPSFFARWHAAYSLGRSLAPGHPLALETLQLLLTVANNAAFQIRSCDALARLSPGDEMAIATLTELLHHPDSSIQRRAAHSLARIQPNCEAAIAKLQHLAQTADPHVSRNAIDSLRQLEAGSIEPNPIVPAKSRSRPPRSPQSIAQEIAALQQKLRSPQHINTEIRYAQRLGRLLPGDAQALETLLQILLCPEQESATYRRAGDCLEEILTTERSAQVIAALQPLAQQAIVMRSAQTLVAYRLLWQIAQRLPYASFVVALENIGK
jgi:hypothetical protein